MYHEFLNLALDGDSHRLQSPPACLREKNSEWISGRDTSRVGVDMEAKRQISSPVGNQSPVTQPVVCHFTAVVPKRCVGRDHEVCREIKKKNLN
jgi:hypothetical protein